MVLKRVFSDRLMGNTDFSVTQMSLIWNEAKDEVWRGNLWKQNTV